MVRKKVCVGSFLGFGKSDKSRQDLPLGRGRQEFQQ